MTILSEKETGMGGKWVLVNYGNDFYAYGVEQDLYSFLGFPVNQCGTKKEIIEHCKSVSELCEQNIEKYQKEFAKDKKNFDGWKNLIEHEKKELEMLTEFAKVLSAKNDGFIEGEDMRGIKNPNVDIKTDGNDVVVTDGNTEYFRRQKTKQTIAIANDIYFAEKYVEV